MERTNPRFALRFAKGCVAVDGKLHELMANVRAPITECLDHRRLGYDVELEIVVDEASELVCDSNCAI